MYNLIIIDSEDSQRINFTAHVTRKLHGIIGSQEYWKMSQLSKAVGRLIEFCCRRHVELYTNAFHYRRSETIFN